MTTTTSNRPGDVSVTRYSLDSTRILRECCEQSLNCRFQLVHSVYSVHATFIEMHEEWIEMHLSSNERESPLVQHAIGCISFPYGTYSCAFLGCLVELRRELADEFRIFVTFPKQLVVTNLRRSFRVPVVEKSGLETRVRTKNKDEFTVVAHDITEGGIGIEFPPGTDPKLDAGSTISVEIKFRGEVVVRSGEVCRTSGNRYGVVFSGANDDHSQRQASSMRSIVLSLQQIWLKSRLQ